jgi:regulator of sigma E protease
VELTYERDGERTTVTLTPVLDEESGRYLYGLQVSSNYRTKGNVLTNLKNSFYEVRYWIYSTIQSLRLLVTRQLTANDLSGPVGIVKSMGDVYEESVSTSGVFYGIMNMINWMIMLSANLGVMNLLPLPALDGGRLVFLIVELIRGKRIDPNKEGIVHLIGIILLFALMIFVMFNDIRKIFV